MDQATILRVMPRWNPMAHSTVMARAGLFVRAGAYDERVIATHDYALWAELARRGAVFANHHAALVDYRIHPASIKSRQVHESLRNTLFVQERYWRSRGVSIDRLNRSLETALLHLPPTVVNAAFVLVRYRLPMLGVDLRSRLYRRDVPSAPRA